MGILAKRVVGESIVRSAITVRVVQARSIESGLALCYQPLTFCGRIPSSGRNKQASLELRDNKQAKALQYPPGKTILSESSQPFSCSNCPSHPPLLSAKLTITNRTTGISIAGHPSRDWMQARIAEACGAETNVKHIFGLSRDNIA